MCSHTRSSRQKGVRDSGINKFEGVTKTEYSLTVHQIKSFKFRGVMNILTYENSYETYFPTNFHTNSQKNPHVIHNFLIVLYNNEIV